MVREDRTSESVFGTSQWQCLVRIRSIKVGATLRKSLYVRLSITVTMMFEGKGQDVTCSIKHSAAACCIDKGLGLLTLLNNIDLKITTRCHGFNPSKDTHPYIPAFSKLSNMVLSKMADLPVNAAFTQALPKVELHAHLSGSISRATLHTIWQKKKSSSKNDDTPLPDPAIALKPAGTFPTILSFFQIFNDYIYNLVNDRESIAYATRSVVEDFQRDGVRYLELRTTPRHILNAGISREEYVQIVLEALTQHHEAQLASSTKDTDLIEVHLILSIDRIMSAAEADEIVSIAASHAQPSPPSSSSPLSSPRVLAIDLCGNPTKGTVSTFTPSFLRAKTLGLATTVHFAEVPASSTESELTTLLSWSPHRLGHAINIPAAHKAIIKERKLGLELCLSCNVLAEMTQGGFEAHHFGEWVATECAVALSTDDVGVFESALSNEYLIAARAFGLSRGQVVELARRGSRAAFAGRERMERLIEEFQGSGEW
jgi:adenosine deaminase